MKRKRSLKRPRIVIIYHSVSSKSNDEYYSKQNVIIDDDTVNTVHCVEKILKKHKFHVNIIPLDSTDLSPIAEIKADFIFNLVDSKQMELKIARILERMHIPFSGSGFVALSASDSKVKTKAIFSKFLIPTPDYSIIGPKDKLMRSILPSKFPLMLKPAFEHGSVGISLRSVVTSFVQFKKRVKRIRLTLKQSLICERFIRGRELQVTILEKGGYTEALPISEMIIQNGKKNKWNIYGFDEKWKKNGIVFKNLHFISPPKALPLIITRTIQRQAIQAFYAFGFRDYARFDIRYNPKTKLWYFLEGNGNPGMSEASDDSMTASLLASGMTLEEFLLTIIENHLCREII